MNVFFYDIRRVSEVELELVNKYSFFNYQYEREKKRGWGNYIYFNK